MPESKDAASLWGELRSALARPTIKSFKHDVTRLGSGEAVSPYLGDTLISILAEATFPHQKQLLSYILEVDDLPWGFKGELLKRAAFLDLHIRRDHFRWFTPEDLNYVGQRVWGQQIASGHPHLTVLFGLPLYWKKSLNYFEAGAQGFCSLVEADEDELFRRVIRTASQSTAYSLERFNHWLREGKSAATFDLPPKESYENLKGWQCVLKNNYEKGHPTFLLGETLCKLEVERERVVLSLNTTRFRLGEPHARTLRPSAYNWRQFMDLLRDLSCEAERNPDKLLLDGSSFHWWSHAMR